MVEAAINVMHIKATSFVYFITLSLAQINHIMRLPLYQLPLNTLMIKAFYQLPKHTTQYILHFILVALQRLKDYGYTVNNAEEEEEENEDSLSKLEDEVKCAPWHTTKAFLQAAKGKCILQLTGKSLSLNEQLFLLFTFKKLPAKYKINRQAL
jgi:hypothetical protein